MADSLPPRDRKLRQGLLKAATGTLNLSALGLGVAGATVWGSPSLLALGGAAYLALAAWDLATDSFWRRVQAGEGVQPGTLPSAKEIHDRETRDVIARVHKARDTIASVLAETPDEVQAHVLSSLSSLEELDQRIARLARRADEIARHLAQTNLAALVADEREMRARAERTRDADARRNYEQAVVARSSQIQALDDVAKARERLLANLLRIVATLEGIPTRIVRVRALDAEAADGVTDDVGQEINRMNTDLSAFEETLESLLDRGMVEPAGGGASHP